MTYSETLALKALSAITDPRTGRDIIASGLLKDLVFEDGTLRAVLAIDPALAGSFEAVRAQAQEALLALEGVDKSLVILTAHKAAPKLGGAKPKPGNPHQARRPEGYQGDSEIGTVLAVSSAKGGVGKSTMAVNLACALTKLGHKVGLLDADVHGPSAPILLGLQGARAEGTTYKERQMIAPLQAHGLTVMSIGFLTKDDGPIVWRGPMVQGAISRMLWDVKWGELDYLIIDMPPGTGDAQLGLAQDIKPKGAIIVSTPQDLALADARKGVKMFEKVDIPIVGLIENMSVFICPNCETTHPIFGQGGAKAEAEKLGVPFLGAAPLDIAIRQSADKGIPIALGSGIAADVFETIAKAVIEGK